MPLIRSAEDAAFIRSARHLAKQAGVTHAQFETLVGAYDDGVARGLSGPALLTASKIASKSFRWRPIASNSVQILSFQEIAKIA